MALNDFQQTGHRKVHAAVETQFRPESRPESAGRRASKRRRSVTSEVAMAWSWARAHRTTEASAISRVPVAPHSCPAARAPRSSSASIETRAAPKRRASRACRRPSRQACASAPDGTEIPSFSSRDRSNSKTTKRSPRWKASNAPASSVSPFTGGAFSHGVTPWTWRSLAPRPKRHRRDGAPPQSAGHPFRPAFARAVALDHRATTSLRWRTRRRH